ALTLTAARPTPRPTMRTFVLIKGKSRRYWSIVGRWNCLTVSAATSGPGETRTTDFDSEDEVRAELDRLVAEKLAEGYIETTDRPLDHGFTSPLRKALEDALAENPDDLATHMAYADHLSELGDPRGEFIRVQLQLEDELLPSARRKALQKREKELLARHERDWLGSMAGYWIDKLDGEARDLNADGPHDLVWRRGWIESLAFHDADPESAAAAVKRRDLLRCLRELRFEYAHDDNDAGCSDFLK